MFTWGKPFAIRIAIPREVGVGVGVTSYIWHSTDVRAEWPFFSAARHMIGPLFFNKKYMNDPIFLDSYVKSPIFWHPGICTYFSLRDFSRLLVLSAHCPGFIFCLTQYSWKPDASGHRTSFFFFFLYNLIKYIRIKLTLWRIRLTQWRIKRGAGRRGTVEPPLECKWFHFHGKFWGNAGKMIKSTPPPPTHTHTQTHTLSKVEPL